MTTMRTYITLVEAAMTGRLPGPLTEAVVTAYHGSQSPTPNFVMGHTGQNSHTFGEYTETRWGCFFSNNPKFARIYGEVRAYNLTLDHTLDLKADRGNVIHAFVESLDPFDPEERPIWFDAKNVLHGDWYYWQIFEGELGRRFSQFLLQNGYDSATFYEANEDDSGRERESQTIVVLDPSRIHMASPTPVTMEPDEDEAEDEAEDEPEDEDEEW